MQLNSRATSVTAAVTGAYCAVVLLVLEPVVDGLGTHSTLWLLLGAALVGIPSYFFVLGVPRKKVVGVWVLQPPLLRRLAAFLLACVAVASVVTFVIAMRTPSP